MGFEAGDQLGFTDGNGITGSYSAGVLTLSGSASKADYETALRSVAFASSNDDPVASKTVEFKASDATATSPHARAASSLDARGAIVYSSLFL